MVRRALIPALLALVAGALPATATQDGWPALYDVTGVASDDTLNIRSEPGIGGQIVATLPPDATDVEVIMPTDDLTWGLVNSGERSGWVSLAYMRRTSSNWDGQFPDFTRCGGTEPFWSIRRSDDGISLSRLDTDADQSFAVDWEGGALSHRGRHSFRAGDIVGIVSNRLCGDGMSDREYGLEINLILLSEDRHYQGCCSIRPLSE